MTLRSHVHHSSTMCSSHREGHRALCMAEYIRMRWKAFLCRVKSTRGSYAEGCIEPPSGIEMLENPQEGASGAYL